MLEIGSFVPQITASFQKTDDRELKATAAWALARITGDQAYVNYLVDAAQPAIDFSPRVSGEEEFNAYSDALRYLGSLQNPMARETLERALESNNPVVVQYAVVNLLFNQPEVSEKARQVVLRELDGQQRKLGTDLLLNIATQLAEDPQIRSAGEAFDERTGDKSWRLYAVERRQWPIYNWIDDYVVALKK